LSCRTLKERAQLVVGATRLGCHGFRESLEQSRCGRDILTLPDKESLIVFEDPPVYIVGVGTCTPTASMTSDLALEFGVFLL
jgi:hypothetical protein